LIVTVGGAPFPPSAVHKLDLPKGDMLTLEIVNSCASTTLTGTNRKRLPATIDRVDPKRPS
jgi:hypothetical protein